MLRAEGGGGKIKGQKAEVMEGRPVHCWSGRSQSGWFRGYLGAGQGFHCSIRIWPASSLTFISFHPAASLSLFWPHWRPHCPWDP